MNAETQELLEAQLNPELGKQTIPNPLVNPSLFSWHQFFDRNGWVPVQFQHALASVAERR